MKIFSQQTQPMVPSASHIRFEPCVKPTYKLSMTALNAHKKHQNNNIFLSQTPMFQLNGQQDHQNPLKKMRPLSQMIKRSFQKQSQYKFQKSQPDIIKGEKNLSELLHQVYIGNQPSKIKQNQRNQNVLNTVPLSQYCQTLEFSSSPIRKKNQDEVVGFYRENDIINFGKQILEKSQERPLTSQNVYAYASSYSQHREHSKYSGKLIIGQTNIKKNNQSLLQTEPSSIHHNKKQLNQKKINFNKSQQSYFNLAKSLRALEKKKYDSLFSQITQETDVYI